MTVKTGIFANSPAAEQIKVTKKNIGQHHMKNGKKERTNMKVENKFAKWMRNTGPARFFIPVGIILIVVGAFSLKMYLLRALIQKRTALAVLFLSIAKAMVYHQNAMRVVFHQSVRAVYHHTEGVYQLFAMMIYKSLPTDCHNSKMLSIVIYCVTDRFEISIHIIGTVAKLQGVIYIAFNHISVSVLPAFANPVFFLFPFTVKVAIL